jgi:cytochrome c biogenesis factor
LIVEPLVPWIWAGGFVIVAGALIGLFHGARRAERAPEPAAAGVVAAPEPASVGAQ